MKKGLILSLFLITALVLSTAELSIPGIPHAPAVRAGDQTWSALPLPELAGAGNIRALAVVDTNTAFAATSEAVTVPGSPASHILRTTDAGATWRPVGTFDNQNPSGPYDGPALSTLAADLFFAPSPNYAADRTIFVAVSVPGFEAVYRSRNGGDSFALLGARNFTGGERIRAISVAPNYTDATDYSVVVGTMNPADNVQGGLYFYQTSFGGGWTAKTGASDVYAVTFTGGNSLVAIGATDATVGADPVAEFRAGAVSGVVSLPSSSPAMVAIGPMQPGAGQENLRFSVVFPSNWIPGTATDTDVIAYSTGGPSPSGAIFRRNGSDATYSTVNSAVSHGFAALAMTGSAAGGRLFAGGEVAPGAAAVVSHSMDGGRTWNDVPVGDRFGVDGVAPAGANMRVSVSVGGGAVFVGTGGTRGGVFKSPAMGGTWIDSALYSDAIGANLIDWEVADQNNIFFLIDAGGSGKTYLFKTTDGGRSWRRVSRTPRLRSVRASGNFAADNALWADVLWVDGTTLNKALLTRSVDGGNSWNAAGAYPSDTDYATAMTADTDLRLWMVMRDGRVARTEDGGNTWDLSIRPGPGRPMTPIVKSPNFAADRTLLGALPDSPGTVWVSRDAGATWTQFGAMLAGEGLGGVAFSPDYGADKLVYAVTGSSQGGLWKQSDDGSVTVGSPWARIATGADMQMGARVGQPTFAEGILYVPVGDRIVSSVDVKAARPEWRSSAVTSSDAPSVRVVAKVVGSFVTLWTEGLNSSVLMLTDTAAALATPTPAATVGPATPTRTSTPAPKISIALAAGWNLISVPRPLKDASIGAAFMASPTVTRVYTFQDGNWLLATREAAGWTGTLTQIEDGKGYFVYATGKDSVPLELAPALGSPSYPLAAGWNLIGYTDLQLGATRSVISYLSGLGKTWQSLYRYNATSGWELAKPGTGFTEMELGRGYWMYMAQPGVVAP